MTSGDQLWPARGTLLLGATSIFLLIAVLLGWGLLARIDGAVIVSGQIEVESNRQIIQHPEGGVVVQLAVREGDRVKAGALLLRLDDGPLAPEIASLAARRDEILVRRARLEAERDGASAPDFAAALPQRPEDDPARAAMVLGQSRLFLARAESAQRRIEQLGLQSAQITAQLEALTEQVASLDELSLLLKQDITLQQDLSRKGLASAQQLNALRRELTQVEGSRARLLGGKAEAIERAAEIALLADQTTAERREAALTELRDLEPALAELTERLRALELRRQALEIRAPIGGQVYGLRVFAAQTVVRPAEPILFLIPEDRDLVIAALVPTLVIDRLHEGQRVNLRFPGLDFGRARPLEAEIRSLSADAFADEARGPVYRAEIRLAPGEVERLAPGQRLLPGMPVEAYLLLGARRPLAYLLGPLTGYFSRAMRSG